MSFEEDGLNNNVCKALYTFSEGLVQALPENQKQSVGGETNGQPVECFVCVEKSLSDPDCKTCQNIRSYHSNKEREDLLEHASNITFPGPGIVKRNHIYGNYVVASRTIEPGELIILERPITIGPYAPLDRLPLCVACCRDIGLSTKCSKCAWPVCGVECEKYSIHSENECKIFAKNRVKPRGTVNEYFGVETLRALLLKYSNPYAWTRVLEFEPHIQPRSEDYLAKAAADFIVTFIHEKCGLAEDFSAETINHVVGVLSVNSFWTLTDLNKYASCLFDKITLFAHDCDPNTNRKFVILEEDKSDEPGSETNASYLSNVALKVTAARRILPGEIISTRYIHLNQTVAKRRGELKETFYFECTCSRCLTELSEGVSGEMEAEIITL